MVIPYFTHAYNFVQTLGVPQCARHLTKVNLHGKWVRSSNSHKARAYLDLHFLFSEALHSLSSPTHTHTLALEVGLTLLLSVNWLKT